MKSFEDKPIWFGEDVTKLSHLEITNLLKEICPNVFFVCFHAKNSNLIVYELNRNTQGEILDPPVFGYWIMLDPTHMQRRRKEGLEHDREEFGWADSHIAWAFTATKVSNQRVNFHFNRMASAKCAVKINPSTGKMQMFSVHEGRLYVMKYLFVEGSENIHLLDLSQNIRQIYVQGIDVTQKPYVGKTIYLIDHRAEQPPIHH